MTKISLVEKIARWYGFQMKQVGTVFYFIESGENNSYEFTSLEDALRSFRELMIITNNNLKMCHYKIWSDEELSFIASL